MNTLHLATASTVIRLTIHVLAASIWVGGQFVVAGLMGTVRRIDQSAPRLIAQAFARLSWPAFWILIATGFWNYAAVHGTPATSAWNTVFAAKMGLVMVSGVGAFLHSRAPTAARRGAWAGVGVLASTGALVLGIALTN